MAMDKENLITLQAEKSVEAGRLLPPSITTAAGGIESRVVGMTSDVEHNTDMDISRSDSDLEPRSFSQIRKLMNNKRQSNLSTPR